MKGTLIFSTSLRASDKGHALEDNATAPQPFRAIDESRKRVCTRFELSLVPHITRKRVTAGRELMVGACGGSSTLLLHMLDLWVVCAWVARNYILYGRERFARILKVALRMRARAIRSISVYRVGGMVMACYSHAGRVSTSFCAATGLFRYGDLWLRLGIEILLRSSAPPVMWPPLRRVWAFPIWYMPENRELNEI